MSKGENTEGNQDDERTFRKNNEPDVKLDVQKLSVGEVKLELEKLDAKISLKAQLGNFINIDVGTNVHMENVKLDLKEVNAEAVLNVRLERVEKILLKAIDYLENHPQVLESLGPFSNEDKNSQ